MKKQFLMCCLAVMAASQGVQAQGFLKKLNNAVEKVNKSVDKVINSGQGTPAKDNTNSTQAQQSVNQSRQSGSSDKKVTASGVQREPDEIDALSLYYPEGRRSNFFGMKREAALEQYSAFKKTAATKVIPIDGSVSDLRLGYFGDNRVFCKMPNGDWYCLDGQGNVVKKWLRVNNELLNSLSSVDAFPRFHSKRFIYLENNKTTKLNDAVVCDENFKTITRIPRTDLKSSNYQDGVAAIFYFEPDNTGTYFGKNSKRVKYIDVNGNQVFKSLSDSYNNLGTIAQELGNFPVRPLSEGLAAFCIPTTTPSLGYLWGFRDANGKVVIPAKYVAVQDFSNGLAAVATTESGTQKWGYIDKTGKEVIAPKFTKAPSRFDECGLALVINKSDNGLFINKQGEVVSKEYTYVTPFYHGRTLVTTTDYSATNRVINCDEMLNSDFSIVSLIGNSGTRLVDSPKQGFMFGKFDKWYFSPTDYASLTSRPVVFYDGQIYIKTEKKGHGIIDGNGDLVICGLKGPFVEGLAPVQDDKNAGYVNTKGEWVIKFEENEF